MTPSCSELVASDQPPSDECLRKAALHIAHDLDLFSLAWEQQGNPLGYTQWFLCARSLYDFFFEPTRRLIKKGVWKDDILAADYLPPGVWATTAAALQQGQPSKWLDIRETANKLAAHLTYTRIEAAEQGSEEPNEEVHRYLLGVATVWLAALPPEKRVWFGRGPR